MNISGKLSVESPSQEVMELDQLFFPNPWTREQWSDFHSHALFVWRETEVVGFALFGLAPGDDTAHLFKILLHPSRRNDGTSVHFWKEIAQELKNRGQEKVYLEVAATNASAVAFYRKVGFSPLRTIKGYYSNGDDALTMLLTL